MNIKNIGLLGVALGVLVSSGIGYSAPGEQAADKFKRFLQEFAARLTLDSMTAATDDATINNFGSTLFGSPEAFEGIKEKFKTMLRDRGVEQHVLDGLTPGSMFSKLGMGDKYSIYGIIQRVQRTGSGPGIAVPAAFGHAGAKKIRL